MTSGSDAAGVEEAGVAIPGSAWQADVALDLARRVLVRLAPDELPGLEQLAHTLPPAPRRRRRGLLDFGVGETVAVLSPAVMLVANAILNHLADAVGDSVISKAAAVARRVAARLPFARFKKPVEPLVIARRRASGKAMQLSVKPARSRELRRLVRRCALRAGLSKAQAQALEAAFLAELGGGDRGRKGGGVR